MLCDRPHWGQVDRPFLADFNVRRVGVQVPGRSLIRALCKCRRMWSSFAAFVCRDSFAAGFRPRKYLIRSALAPLGWGRQRRARHRLVRQRWRWRWWWWIEPVRNQGRASARARGPAREPARASARTPTQSPARSPTHSPGARVLARSGSGRQAAVKPAGAGLRQDGRRNDRTPDDVGDHVL